MSVAGGPIDPSHRRLAVYCGSSAGHDPVFRRAAGELGEQLLAHGVGLVYGGGHVGLMGVVADAVLGGGGEVVGVMTSDLIRAEVAHDGLTSLEIVDTMHERKARMTELSSGVIVLPGGFGTLDEAFEVLTWNQLGLTAKPVVVLDIDGYFSPLFDFVDGAVRAGFVRAEHGRMLQRAGSPDRAVATAVAASPDFRPKWVS